MIEFASPRPLRERPASRPTHEVAELMGENLIESLFAMYQDRYELAVENNQAVRSQLTADFRTKSGSLYQIVVGGYSTMLNVSSPGLGENNYNLLSSNYCFITQDGKLSVAGILTTSRITEIAIY